MVRKETQQEIKELPLEDKLVIEYLERTIGEADIIFEQLMEKEKPYTDYNENDVHRLLVVALKYRTVLRHSKGRLIYGEERDS